MASTGRCRPRALSSGQLTTYTALGTIAGTATALFASTTGFAWLSATMLVLAAVLMALQALGLAFGGSAPLAGVLAHLTAPLSASHGPAARYALGLVLGLLPCGLLYGALAAAAGTASALGGAMAMAAFALGTVPALIAVGWAGLIVRRQLRGVTRWDNTTPVARQRRCAAGAGEPALPGLARRD